MRARRITRIVGLIVGIAIIAALALGNGDLLTKRIPYWPVLVVVVAAAAGLVGYIIGPLVIIRPSRWVYEQIRHANVGDILAGVSGLIIGLIIAALLTLPLSQLRFLSLGTWLPTVAALLCGTLGVTIAVQMKPEFIRLATGWGSRGARREKLERERDAESGDTDDGEEREEREPRTLREKGRLRLRGKPAPAPEKVLVDTSAIIDGRIADIGQTGFISGTLVVPRFVLEELQHIADSSDSLRRNRGRRGLDILSRLQKETTVPVEITDADAEGTHEVDAKLVKLARQWHCSIITNDFNLNRVAGLQGVKVLNINELAHAVKPILLPGEEMPVKIIQDGKEPGQGVGYLDDGTMIVVEGGRQHVGNTLDVTVTRVLQTIAGRMIFAQPKPGQSVASGTASANGGTTTAAHRAER
jgi:uncharacterized protein YacL